MVIYYTDVELLQRCKEDVLQRCKEEAFEKKIMEWLRMPTSSRFINRRGGRDMTRMENK